MKATLLTGLLLLLIVTQGLAQESGAAALITSVRGQVGLVTATGQKPLEPLSRLASGDLLAFGKGATLQILYTDSGRQETWQGPGRLEILRSESRPFGIQELGLKTLPISVSRQIANTPEPDGKISGKAVRQRAIAGPDALPKLEASYKRLKMEAVAGDNSPDLYWLSGLYEIGEYDRLEQAMGDLERARRGDMEVQVIVALYQKALKSRGRSR